MHSHTIHFNNILQDSSFLLDSLFIFWVWLELLMQKVFLFLEKLRFDQSSAQTAGQHRNKLI